MPRYFFHVHNGRDMVDKTGTVLDDADAARRDAVRDASALLCEVSEAFWQGKDWQMNVTDESGLVLFTLHFMGIVSPAARMQLREQ